MLYNCLQSIMRKALGINRLTKTQSINNLNLLINSKYVLTSNCLKTFIPLPSTSEETVKLVVHHFLQFINSMTLQGQIAMQMTFNFDYYCDCC